VYGGRRWDLNAPKTDVDKLQFAWSDVVASLSGSRWYAPVAIQHARNGRGHGLTERVVELTRAQAAKLGMAQEDARMLYAGLDVTDAELAADYDGGRLQYVSPGFTAGVVDDRGKRIPIQLSEISFVTVPHRQGQTPISAMREVHLAGCTLEQTMEKIEALKKILADAGVADDIVAAAVAAIADEAPLADEVETEVGTEGDGDVVEMSARERVLTAQLAEARLESAKARVDADLRGRVVSSAARTTLVNLASSKDAGYVALLSELAPATTHKTSLPTNRAISPQRTQTTSASLSDQGVARSRFAAAMSGPNADADAVAVLEGVASARKISFAQAYNFVTSTVTMN
jgi:hypothetical protein